MWLWSASPLAPSILASGYVGSGGALALGGAAYSVLVIGVYYYSGTGRALLSGHAGSTFNNTVASLNAWDNITSSDGSTTTLSHASSAGADRFLLVALTAESSTDPAPTAVSYGGQACTLLGSVRTAAGTNQHTIYVWYCKETQIAARSNDTVSVTYTYIPSGTDQGLSINAATYSGVDQVTPIPESHSAFSDAATPNPITTVDLTTCEAGDYAVGASGDGNSDTPSWAAGVTQRVSATINATAQVTIADSAVAASGTIAIRNTWGAQNRRADYSVRLLRKLKRNFAYDVINGKRFFSGSATTTHTRKFSYSGSGSAVFHGSGVTTHTRKFSYTGSGSVTLSGSATTTHTRKFSYTGSGSVTLSGSRTATLHFIYTGFGSATLSGFAITARADPHYVYVASGTAFSIGGGDYSIGYYFVGSGSANFSGSAATSYTKKFNYTGSGSANFSGAAITVQTKNYSYTGSGSVTLSGSAITAQTTEYSYVSLGTANLSGAATTSQTREFSYFGSGSANFSGSGTANHTREFSYTGFGSANLS
jgi:hypothetical protein